MIPAVNTKEDEPKILTYREAFRLVDIYYKAKHLIFQSSHDKLMILLWIIFFSFLSSVGAIIAASAFLLIPEKTQKILIPCLIAYATGTLLAAALLGLIPHALTHLVPSRTLSTILCGIILFFMLEKLVIWRHCHNNECEVHGTVGPMILIGDAFHNAVDGVVIAASFLTSIYVGIAASFSIIAHEIAQEVGDFAIILHSGYSKRKALSLNILSSLSTFLTAILAYYALEQIHTAIPYVMAIAAASFLYIALVDLSPELHRKVDVGATYAIRQFILLIIGVGTILLVLRVHP
ncbi:MAG: ZIP family metal transporter [Candidatus Hodarchaeota archaeon]